MSRALGRYELLRPLARGGMAEVYLARRRTAGIEKWLVVKRIRPERSGDTRFLDLFVREARLSMSLVHQNIVPVFDFGRIDDQVFLAMERVEGKDLGSTLARCEGRRVTPLIAAFIAAECCQALDYAHHRKSPEGAPLGIVHRDVTPRNVLLSWSGEVKLTDFGIAALAGDAAAKLLGTPAYMAPEQARSEPVDARADVYAVGLLLREMLTGQRARPGTERDTFVEAAKIGAMLPWPEDLASPLIAIVDRATALRAEDRYPDASAMAAELDTAIVAERAARKSEPPARLLAAWLAQIWAGERDDQGADGEVEGNHLVSFLDDGALDVMGTGTVRSMLATAGDDLEPPPAAPAATPPPSDSGGIPSSTIEVRASAGVPVRVPTDPSGRASSELAALRTGSGELATLPPERPVRPLRIAAIVIGAGGLGALAMFVLRPDEARTTDDAAVTAQGSGGAPREAPPAIDAQLVVNAPVDAPPDAEALASAPIDAQVVAAGSGSASPDGGRNRPTNGQGRPASGRPTPGTKPAQPAAGSNAGSAAAPVVTARRVTINATPWAYFTVDGDPTQHETVKTLLLAPGKHRFHFKNPVLKVERDVTIEVPDRDFTYVQRMTE